MPEDGLIHVAAYAGVYVAYIDHVACSCHISRLVLFPKQRLKYALSVVFVLFYTKQNHENGTQINELSYVYICV